MGKDSGNKQPPAGDYVLLRPDRRKELRRDILVIKVSGETSNVFFGYAKNISKGGLFIATVNPRRAGEEFTISFKHPGDGAAVKCLCRVMWAREYKPKSGCEPGMGIKFLNLDDGTQKKIEEWVKKG